MKLSELLLTGGSKGAPMSLPSSFDGFGGTAGHGAQGFGGTAGHGAQGQFADPTGAGGGQPIDGGEWWQDEAGHWHFGGPAEYWFRDEHHQWHKGGETQLWRQDETGNWHEVQEDHPKSSEDELMMAAGPHDMGAPDDDIKDLDALNEALKDEMPPMDPSFTPSIENIITQSGPNELGKNVAELSRSLGTLKDDVNSHLSQDRIAAMTAEDVPNMVTPVAASLKEVIQSAKSLKERLTAISDAAYSIVGTASEDVEERLEGDEPSANEELPEPHEADHGYEYGHGGPDDYAYGSGGYDDYTYGHGNPDDYSYGHHGGHGGTEMAVQGAQVPLLLWKAPTPAAERLAQRRRSFL